MKEAQRAVKQLLDIANIDQVVYVDDLFATKPPEFATVEEHSAKIKFTGASSGVSGSQWPESHRREESEPEQAPGYSTFFKNNARLCTGGRVCEQ